jgi:pantothenate kinase
MIGLLSYWKVPQHPYLLHSLVMPNALSADEPGALFPYLLVNIGSGVSMIRVTGEGQFERISGSSLGGGTFWGLCRLLTGLHNFDDMLAQSAQGDNGSVSWRVVHLARCILRHLSQLAFMTAWSCHVARNGNMFFRSVVSQDCVCFAYV